MLIDCLLNQICSKIKETACVIIIIKLSSKVKHFFRILKTLFQKKRKSFYLKRCLAWLKKAFSEKKFQIKNVLS